ncbi:uncharacterized protein LOC131875702 [Cryptomeria japonica]|uniref:uncharacterized protein LOC131875702 n=1 Tax=Cryptomeria japonica TaxID=3369 RepID=UPI0027DA6C02|nr:uncharacterized protein LOC131875702 [Cryptomeria japonica]
MLRRQPGGGPVAGRSGDRAWAAGRELSGGARWSEDQAGWRAGRRRLHRQRLVAEDQAAGVAGNDCGAGEGWEVAAKERGAAGGDRGASGGREVAARERGAVGGDSGNRVAGRGPAGASARKCR